MTRGRPLGSKTGPRVGSRPWTLLNLQPGESLFFQAANGVPRLMAQISTDRQRNGLSGLITLEVFLAIQPSTREVVELVRATRNPE